MHYPITILIILLFSLTVFSQADTALFEAGNGKPYPSILDAIKGAYAQFPSELNRPVEIRVYDGTYKRIDPRLLKPTEQCRLLITSAKGHFPIVNCEYSPRVYVVPYTTIRGFLILNNRNYQGVHASPSCRQVVITHNFFHNCAYSHGTGAVHVQGTDTRVEYNIFWKCFAAIRLTGATRTLVNHNTFIMDALGPVNLGGNSAGTYSAVTNNIMMGGSNHLILIFPGEKATLHVDYNIYWLKNSGSYNFEGETHSSKYFYRGGDFNAWRAKTQLYASDLNDPSRRVEDHGMEKDPLLENKNSGDFRLKAGSPCIGTASDGGDMGALPFGISVSKPQWWGYGSVSNDSNGEFQAQGAEIRVFPNPFKSVINVSVSYQLSAISEVNLNMFDVNGRLVKKLTAGMPLNISEMASGIYFLKVNTNNQTLTKKIMLYK
jgi:hypothetical protein